ncbi:hypothetical protein METBISCDRAFT_27124 [Metschnikowia bicuspidata]|uniref:Uncharacterized protein n=1 Tax=Metschnikowia bicuspidata TaxID=27322 RepID=A0A4V1J342_9ASCO|nr:hypothetical protein METBISCDRAFT_27124 [Metschnikowia bicuspidata]
MDALSDSDPENSLPLLPDAAVDVDRLRNFLSFASRETRERLRREAAETDLRRVFENSELYEGPSSVDFFHIPSSSPHKPASSPVQETRVPAALECVDIDAVSPSLSRSYPGHEQVAKNASFADVGVPDASTSHETTNHPASASAPPETAETERDAWPSRSLRQRTFASKHPYIADQADYLEICSIQSINEMFGADADLAGVVRTLNRLYMRKKKWYPDEFRYKSANFYVHLGRSRARALQGDADAENQVDLSSSQVSDGTFAPKSESGRVDEVLSPNNGVRQSSSETDVAPPDDILRALNPAESSSDDDSWVRSAAPPRIERDSDSESDSDQTSESEPEQMVRVGGRYRKLSRILKGVLPESAKRLSMFQYQEPVRKKRIKHRAVVPRKGLAQRKFGSASSKTRDLQQELMRFSDSDEDAAFSRSHLVQTNLDVESPALRQFGDAYISEVPECNAFSSDEEPFSDRSVSPSGSPLLDTYLHEFDSVWPEQAENYENGWVTHVGLREAPEIAVQVAHRSPKAPSGGVRQNPALGRSRALSTRTRRVAMLAKLAKRPFHQRARVADLVGRIPWGLVRRETVRKQPADSPRKQPVNSPQTTKNVPPAPKTHPRTKSPEHPDTARKYAHLDFKRTPTASTVVYEIESTEKFVRLRKTAGFRVPVLLPTKEDLFAEPGLAGNPLLCEGDFARGFAAGINYFTGEDGVCFTLGGTVYTLGLYRLKESREQETRLFTAIHVLLARTHTFLSDLARHEVSAALVCVMKWLLIVNSRPTADQMAWVAALLALFSKFQEHEVRRLQCAIHSQLLFVLWLLYQLENAHAPGATALQRELNRSAADFWLLFFVTWRTDDLRDARPGHSAVYDAVRVLRVVCSDSASWWLPIEKALSEAVSAPGDPALVDQMLFLAAVVPRTEHSWAPFLAVLRKFQRDVSSHNHHGLLDACDVAVLRLGWPWHELVLVAVYASFAQRKFANFDDEHALQVIGTVRAVADLSDRTVFDRFLVLVYRYVSDLDSSRSVKRLVSKLVPSSAFVYTRERRSRTAFVNRANLLLLFSQVSTLDLGVQFVGLVDQVCGVDDAKTLVHAADAVAAYCVVARTRRHEWPVDAIVRLLSCGVLRPFSTVMAVLGTLVRGNSGVSVLGDALDALDDAWGDSWGDALVGLNERVPVDAAAAARADWAVLVDIFARVDLGAVPDAHALKMLALLVYAFHVPSASQNASQYVLALQRRVTALLDAHMRRWPPHNTRIRDAVEMGILLWNRTAAAAGNRHWNVMMYQKFSFMGTDQLRRDLVCLFALEYLHENAHVRPDDVASIDKILMRALCALFLAPYVLGLFIVLARDARSLFFGTHAFTTRTNATDALYALLANRVKVLTAVVHGVRARPAVAPPEKDAWIVYLVECLRAEYSRSFGAAGYPEMCRHLMDAIHSSSRPSVSEMAPYWDFAAVLGLSSTRRQATWYRLTDAEKMAALHCELVYALQFETRPLQRMHSWLADMDASLVYALVEVYVCALRADPSYWCHLAHALALVLLRLRRFEGPHNDAFLRLADVLTHVAAVSSNRDAFEVQAVCTCVQILDFGVSLYDGYLEQDAMHRHAHDFVAGIETDASQHAWNTRHFSALSVAQLIAMENPQNQAAPRLVYDACLRRVDASDDAFELMTRSVLRLRRRVSPDAPSVLDFDLTF